MRAAAMRPFFMRDWHICAEVDPTRPGRGRRHMVPGPSSLLGDEMERAKRFELSTLTLAR